MMLKAVFFDMGGTLLDYHPEGGDWQAMERLGAAGLYAYLSGRNYPLPDEQQVLEDWWLAVSGAWKSLRHAPKDRIRQAVILREVAQAWGIAPSEEEFLAAEQAFVTAIQGIVRPLPGALEAVQWVKARGLFLGLISNTVWQGSDHQRDLARYGFWEHFDYTCFSADVLAWKPEADIFRLAEKAANAAPDECVYIGDSLFFDVFGAGQAGWRTVWVEQPLKWMPPDMPTPTPDASLSHMAELPQILENWLSSR